MDGVRMVNSTGIARVYAPGKRKKGIQKAAFSDSGRTV